MYVQPLSVPKNEAKDAKAGTAMRGAPLNTPYCL